MFNKILRAIEPLTQREALTLLRYCFTHPRRAVRFFHDAMRDVPGREAFDKIAGRKK